MNKGHLQIKTTPYGPLKAVVASFAILISGPLPACGGAAAETRPCCATLLPSPPAPESRQQDNSRSYEERLVSIIRNSESHPDAEREDAAQRLLCMLYNRANILNANTLAFIAASIPDGAARLRALEMIGNDEGALNRIFMYSLYGDTKGIAIQRIRAIARETDNTDSLVYIASRVEDRIAGMAALERIKNDAEALRIVMEESADEGVGRRAEHYLDRLTR